MGRSWNDGGDYHLSDGPRTSSSGAVVKAEPLPANPELEIMSDQRATHHDRAKVEGQLGEALADGRIDEAVHDARVAFAQKAKTMTQVNSVLTDLPARYDTAMTQPSYRLGKMERHSEKQDKWISELEVTSFLAGLWSVISACVLGGISASSMIHQHIGLGVTLAVFAVGLVIGGVLSTTVALKPRPGVDD